MEDEELKEVLEEKAKEYNNHIIEGKREINSSIVTDGRKKFVKAQLKSDEQKCYHLKSLIKLL